MQEKVNKSLSDYLKLIRFKKKKSQLDIAKILGVSRNTYSIWENNPINLKLNTLIEISSAMEEDVLSYFNELIKG